MSRAWVILSLSIFIGTLIPTSVAFGALSPGLIISLTNTDRAANDLPALSENTLLDQAAQLHANDMAAKGYYSHITPEGYSPLYWVQKVGYQYLNVGENLDLIYSGDEETVNNAWMGSPEHRANILLPQFTDIGVAIASGLYQENPAMFIVEFFATPLPPPSPLKPKYFTPPSEENVVSTTTPVENMSPPVMIPSSFSSAPITAAASSVTPSWAIFQIQYSPQRFVYALQLSILSIQESAHELSVQLSMDGVY